MQNSTVSTSEQHQVWKSQHQADLQQMQADHEAKLSQLHADHQAALTAKDASIASSQAWRVKDINALRARTNTLLAQAADKQRASVSVQLAQQASRHAKVHLTLLLPSWSIHTQVCSRNHTIVLKIVIIVLQMLSSSC